MNTLEKWTLVFLLGAAREAWTRSTDHTSIAIWHHAIQRQARELGFETVGVK